MELVWLIAPIGVLVVGLLYAWAPRYHENRAERLLQKGRDRQAAQQFDKALRIWTRRQGRTSLAAVPALAGLARIRFLQGMPDQGHALLDEASRIVVAAPAKLSSRRLRAWLRVGQAALAAKRYAEASGFAERAAAVAPRLFGYRDPVCGEVELLLADAYSGQEFFERALVHYECALQIFQRAGGEDSAECGAVFASMAASLARQERWREAREAGLEAVEILDQSDSARLPEALSALADLHARRGRLAEAEGLRVSICHLREKLGGHDSAALAREYERRAELLKAMERLTEASYLMGKADKIRRAGVSA